MNNNQFSYIINHLWKYKEYLIYLPDFDYPFYGGLKSKMGKLSPEATDAMQIIWNEFKTYKTKKEFSRAYKQTLKKLGETVKI